MPRHEKRLSSEAVRNASGVMLSSSVAKAYCQCCTESFLCKSTSIKSQIMHLPKESGMPGCHKRMAFDLHEGLAAQQKHPQCCQHRLDKKLSTSALSVWSTRDRNIPSVENPSQDILPLTPLEGGIPLSISCAAARLLYTRILYVICTCHVLVHALADRVAL